MRKLTLCLLVLGVSLATSAAAQDYPVKNIRSICAYPAGSGADIVVRYFSRKLGELAGKPVIVENVVGAQGNLATETVAKAAPDGYTIYITPASSTNAAAKYMFKSLPFDPIKDFTPVTTLISLPFALAINPKTPANSVAELTDYIRTKGRKAFGSATPALTVASELYRTRAGLEVQRVLYRGPAQVLTDLNDGLLDYAFVTVSSVAEHWKAGRLKLLAVTSAERSPATPELPTMAEFGFPGYDLRGWWAVLVPAGAPQPIVDKLETWFNRIAASDETRQWLTTQALDPLPGNQKIAADMLRADLAKWAEYAKLAGIEPQ